MQSFFAIQESVYFGKTFYNKLKGFPSGNPFIYKLLFNFNFNLEGLVLINCYLNSSLTLL